MSDFADRMRHHMTRPEPIVARRDVLVPLAVTLRQIERMAANIAWEGGDPSRLDRKAKDIRERMARGEEWEILF